MLTEAQALLAPSRRQALRDSLLVWLTQVYLPDQLPDVEWSRFVELAEVPEMLGRRRLTWAEQWKRDGLKEGRQEGRREMQCSTLERQSRKRFGSEVAAEVAERLQFIGNLQRLEALAEDFLDCTTAEEWLARLTPDADAA